MEVYVQCNICDWNTDANISDAVLRLNGIVANGELFNKVNSHHLDPNYRGFWGGHSEFTLLTPDGTLRRFTAGSYCLDFNIR